MVAYVAIKPNDDGYVNFSAQDHQVWQTLITRQKKTIVNRACQAFMDGLTILDLPEDRIPQLDEVTAKINCTGWEVKAVDGTIQVDAFFDMLSKRQFPVATFIRVPEELDYLQQPDIFHEIFGHCPMLTNQAYADFVQWYGEFGLSLDRRMRRILGRLFWFTVEFGLIQEGADLRIYGGGILSSHQETIFCVESDEVKRYPLSAYQALQTPYDYTVIQPAYFIIDSLESLYDIRDEEVLLGYLNRVDSEQKKVAVC